MRRRKTGMGRVSAGCCSKIAPWEPGRDAGRRRLVPGPGTSARWGWCRSRAGSEAIAADPASRHSRSPSAASVLNRADSAGRRIFSMAAAAAPVCPPAPSGSGRSDRTRWPVKAAASLGLIEANGSSVLRSTRRLPNQRCAGTASLRACKKRTFRDAAGEGQGVA
jgi:hypothetical protein